MRASTHYCTTLSLTVHGAVCYSALLFCPRLLHITQALFIRYPTSSAQGDIRVLVLIMMVMMTMMTMPMGNMWEATFRIAIIIGVIFYAHSVLSHFVALLDCFDDTQVSRSNIDAGDYINACLSDSITITVHISNIRAG